MRADAHSLTTHHFPSTNNAEVTKREIHNLPETQRACDSVNDMRERLLGSALQTTDGSSRLRTRLFHRHRRDRSAAPAVVNSTFRFSTHHSHSTLSDYFPSVSVSRTSMMSTANRYDPMGFQWPLGRSEKASLECLYAQEDELSHRMVYGWTKFIRADADLKDHQKAKKLARLGIPHQFRPFVWTAALGSQALAVRNKNLYQSGFWRET
eukprot:Gregarina_sp_Poly_1__4140@NODE_2266_length_2381_cov_171_633967_g1453_i0_p3_GENE_NODE_2266_length_2381_cov_171_633967_g1453_i0NODE_2266_length_2381_cov_171_633967_g1453_i0_p3_ORF_typecomplete_len209_score14_96_NODE_2266_length_2381_cov_171_633967_g1453_i017302356